MGQGEPHMSDAANAAPTAPADVGPEWYRDSIKSKEAENESLKAQLAALTQSARAREFDDAGIPAEGWGKAFREGFAGDMTQEAIKAERDAWNIPTVEPAPAPTPEPSSGAADELEALAQAQAVRGQQPPQESSDPLLGELQQIPAGGEYEISDIEAILEKHGVLSHID